MLIPRHIIFLCRKDISALYFFVILTGHNFIRIRLFYINSHHHVSKKHLMNKIVSCLLPFIVLYGPDE